MPVAIPKGVEVNRDGNVLRVKGPKGELSNRIPPGLTVSIDGGEVRIARSGDQPDAPHSQDPRSGGTLSRNSAINSG